MNRQLSAEISTVASNMQFTVACVGEKKLGYCACVPPKKKKHNLKTA